MPLTPFTLQKIISDLALEEAQQQSSTPSQTTTSASSPISLFHRRTNANSGGAGSGTRFGSGIGWGARDRVTVETVEAWENNIYVGTSDGHLIHYVLEDQTSSENPIPKSYLIDKQKLGFGRKLVEHSTLSFYALPEMTPLPVSAFPHIKGVTCFTHDLAKEGQTETDGSVKLCVLKKRTVHEFSLLENLVECSQSIPLPHGGIVCCQYGSSLCIADSTHNYRLIDLDCKRMIDLMSPQERSSIYGSGTFKPIVTVIEKGEFLLNTTIGQFMSSAGEPVRGVLQWTSFPRAIGVEYPYVVALLRNNTIEIHNVIDQNLVQTVQLAPAEARTISQGPGIKVWVSALLERLRWENGFSYKDDDNEDSHDFEGENERALSSRKSDDASKEDSKNLPSTPEISQLDFLATVPTRIIIAARDSILALAPSPLILQVDSLLDANRIEEGLAYADEAVSRLTDNVHRKRMQHELNYIYQKSGFILIGETLFDIARDSLDRGHTDPRVVIGLFPDLKRLVDKDCSLHVYAGVKVILDRLGSIDDVVFKSLIKNYEPHIKPNVQSSPATQGLRKQLLAHANEMLQKYLTKDRENRKSSKGPLSELDRNILKAVDNALVQLYTTSDSKEPLISLLKDENECSLEDCEHILSNYGKYYALSLLYQSKKQYAKTLKIWQQMMNNEKPDPDFKDGLKQMADLLTQTDDSDLVWEYASWIISKDQILGAQICIRPNLRKPLIVEPNKVIEALGSVGYEGLTMYLEHLVLQRKSEEESHHTKLLLLYIGEILRELEKDEDKSKLIKLTKEFQYISKNSSMTYISFLSNRPSDDGISHARLKAIMFMQQQSTRYEGKAILEKLLESKQDLYPELAIIYGKLNEHEKSLHILVDQLKDYRGAEAFCLYAGRMIGINRKTSELLSPAKLKRQTADNQRILEDKRLIGLRKALFLKLLKVYLGMKNGDDSVDQIVDLLNKQASYFDIVEVLRLLPEVWSIEMLSEFLIRSLRQSYHDYRESQILKGLLRGENMMVNSELYKAYDEVGPIVITSNLPCASCNKIITDSMVLRQPNKDIIHLHHKNNESGSSNRADVPVEAE
ncbi:9361_t:CDS:10 [Ambispora gerdemannii]|uniref:9361_t:CDS:1 n=1 Tax=Ambispora gerdemannii TaxID=144530 RepID=A0A9N9BSK0_9GLOM|nr:9361_t:CDS:10 [Ambispora gerdemannii]